ncbi:MAG: hypothetical protein ACUVSX_03560 [Aggregatilineales bacterium]
MAVLIFLIVLDVALVALVLYFVVREPQHRQPAHHPFLAEAAEAGPSAAADESAPAQPPESEAE